MAAELSDRLESGIGEGPTVSDAADAGRDILTGDSATFVLGVDSAGKVCLLSEGSAGGELCGRRGGWGDRTCWPHAPHD